MNINNVIVDKPWGYEYQSYESDEVVAWFLHIDKDQATSLHCHPNKKTSLLVLNGDAEISFLNSSYKMLSPPDKVTIRSGLFHSTKALSDGGVDLLEFETSKDKYDLVRLEDCYGRECKPYEDISNMREKDDSCLLLGDITTSIKYKNVVLGIMNLSPNSKYYDIHKDNIIAILKGGFYTKEGQGVLLPGDIVNVHTYNRMRFNFEMKYPTTLLLVNKT